MKPLLSDEHVDVFAAVQLKQRARLRTVRHARPRRAQPARRAHSYYTADVGRPLQASSFAF